MFIFGFVVGTCVQFGILQCCTLLTSFLTTQSTYPTGQLCMINWEEADHGGRAV
jgi:hypothetical protein